MANQKTIGDYTAAVSIDGSTHYLLIQPGSSSTAYNKINRNVFLGVSGQPVDISSIQNLTNKVLDDTNTVTLKDTLFTLQDDSDTTKQAKFQLSGITTATTRTYTLPNASSTLVDIATAQTLTNKTLTSPTITGGSIDNSTVTVDAITGHTASTTGSIYGVSVSSSKISGASITNATIPTAAITDSAITPAKLLTGTGSTWVWQSWTPTFTAFTLGNGVLTAKYSQTGKTVNFHLKVVLGTTSIMGSSPTYTLPVTTTADYANNQDKLWNMHIEDAGIATYFGISGVTSTTVAALAIYNAAGTILTNAAITSSAPMSWGTGDSFSVTGFYEAA